MPEYIEREAAIRALTLHDCDSARAKMAICDIPAADVVEVVRCLECRHSRLPAVLTQKYGKPGTLTCNNIKAPCNHRNVNETDFCSFGERRNDDAVN